ncbi:peptidylprolyl isomerase [Paenibacillus sp. NPDC058071]|uniref:peptidylprolyl isomerase n=1 Tax=Paenibacillus sp. NPDC058071 TaxID=3346326 RepID=UPI0036DD6C7A
MNRFGVLKTVIVLQAVCMIVLSVVVIVKLYPFGGGPDGRNSDSGAAAHTEGDGEDEDGASVAAIVGGIPILTSELEGLLREQYGDAVLRTMMVHKAIDLEAENRRLEVPTEEQGRELAAMIEGYESEEAFYHVMKEQLGMSKEQVLEDLRYRLLLEKIAVLSVDVSDSDVEIYIVEHPELFASQLQLGLQWIVTDTSRESEIVLEMLESGEDFAAVAKTYSTDDFTSDAGGELGLIDSDDPFYNEEMLDTASRLQPGEMAGPIRVDGGYAVIRLKERQKTAGLTGIHLHDEARKQLALSRAKPMRQIEDELLAKYDAVKKG